MVIVAQGSDVEELLTQERGGMVRLYLSEPLAEVPAGAIQVSRVLETDLVRGKQIARDIRDKIVSWQILGNEIPWVPILLGVGAFALLRGRPRG